MCLLPRLQCSHELLEFPLAQRPVEFYVGRVQFELKEPRFFALGFAASKPPVFPTSEFGKREAAVIAQVVFQAAQHRQTDLQPRWSPCCCGSVLLPPPCLTFNYPWCCECNANLFVQLEWDKRAILWAGKMATAVDSTVGRWSMRVMSRALGYFCFILKGDPELQQLRV